MPNHVTTIVTASSTVLKSMLNNAGDVDFNSVIPQPEFLNNFGCLILSIDPKMVAQFAEYLNSKNSDIEFFIDNNFFYSFANKFRFKDGTQVSPAFAKQLAVDFFATKDGIEQPVIDNFILQVQAVALTGFTTPLDWNRANWGTKWNAYECVVDLDNDQIQFDTAWAMPEPVLLALSQNFPEETIHIKWADEDLGNNCGEATLKNGEIVWLENDEISHDVDYWLDFASQVKYGISYAELNEEHESD